MNVADLDSMFGIRMPKRTPKRTEAAPTYEQRNQLVGGFDWFEYHDAAHELPCGCLNDLHGPKCDDPNGRAAYRARVARAAEPFTPREA